MPEIIFPGPDGRLEARMHSQTEKESPIALILHPSPELGGTMNNRIVHQLYYIFHGLGFTVMRLNFRGVGRSQAEFDDGVGELSDAAAALDYLQALRPAARLCWIAGFSFGAWIAMQLLMRRPEIAGFISVSPPANMHDFTFLAPCPSSGLLINGGADGVCPPEEVTRLAERLQAQKGIVITHETIPAANHFFTPGADELEERVTRYLRRRLGLDPGGEALTGKDGR